MKWLSGCFRVDKLFRTAYSNWCFPKATCRMNQGAIDYNIENITHLHRKLPQGALFGAMGIGPSQHPATIASLLLGGNVRVGFEDNIYFRKGELATSNAQLVERIVSVATDLGYEIATPDEAREILGIKKIVQSV